ncbi:MAG TPA: hypothetical protein VGM76_10040 [Lacipirellulaceae bacterium]
MAKARSIRWLFLLSFPLMLATTWTALAAFAHYQRSHLAELITKELVSGDQRGSLAAVRQLALTPRPLLEPIVAVAASTDRGLARGAQLVLSDLVDQWQQQLDAGRDAQLAAEGVDDLATALDANRDSFSTYDAPWLTRTVGQLVRLGNRVPLNDGLEFTAHCESLLVTAGQHRVANAAASLPPATSLPPLKPSPSEPTSATKQPPRSEVAQATDITPLHDFTTSAAASAFNAPPASAYQRIAAPNDVDATQSNDGTSPSATSTSQAELKARWDGPSTKSPTTNSDQARGSAAGSANSATDKSSRGGSKLDAPTPSSADIFKSVDSRSLLKRWLAANESDRSPLAQELARRGFGKPNAELVTVLFSDRTDDRVRLVQEIASAPGVDVTAWLSLLTDDPDAEVRLAAVTLMATSNDPQLAEQAYQVAIHDRDPQVADLAGRLRDRRDNVQRR